ncbi:hypothetical protein [Azotobacter chroococcum]|uniref:Uncharacterized protein n=1 Tax=Azotobacter chroococcum TaxID=353 RepID=A0AAP9Y8S1_9GAMM|nr:hypothetical protein [Azotobacter chroococcum]QQE86942.1 hypothetical protein GKQ51_11405 [Azotobacter chroococcum]
MGTWVEQVHKRAAVFHDQIVATRQAQIASGVVLADAIEFLQRNLQVLYEEEMPLAKIYDNSDLVFHAEGPTTSSSMPGLHAFNWLCNSAEKQIRVLARSIFELSNNNAKILANKLDLRFSGFAPGSIYAGFTLPTLPSIMGSDEIEMIHHTLKVAVRQLPAIPEFICDETISRGIADLIPDPALRDASLEAVFRLSPTGRAGIHTIDISSPDANQSALTVRERVVLREVLAKPIKASRKFGRFVGEVREIDLDSGRFHLRNIESIGTLRCVMPEVTSETGKKLLGNYVMVEGDYESDASGRPRLMFSTHVKPIKKLMLQDELNI